MKIGVYGCYLMENVEDVVWKLCVEKLIVVMLIFFFKKSGQKMWVRWWELSIRCSWKIFFSNEVENIGVHRDDANECRKFVPSLLYIQQLDRKREKNDMTNEKDYSFLFSLSRSISCLIACQWWRWMYLFELTHLHFFFLWCFIFLRHAFIRVLFKFAWFLVTLTPLPLRINHDRVFK